MSRDVHCFISPYISHWCDVTWVCACAGACVDWNKFSLSTLWLAGALTAAFQWRHLATRGAASGGVQPRAQGVHSENGRYRPVEPRLKVYSHVHRSYPQERAVIGTWIRVWKRTATFTGRTHWKGPVTKRLHESFEIRCARSISAQIWGAQLCVWIKYRYIQELLIH